MNLVEILQSKAFIIIAVIVLVGGLLYLSGAWGILKKVIFDILWNKNTNAFDYNNLAKSSALFTALFLIYNTHVQIKFNPFHFDYDKPSPELIALLLLYSLGESAFKMWTNRSPGQPNSEIKVTSETTNITPTAATPARSAKPAKPELVELSNITDKG